jgi:hypothetical protein
MRLIEGGALTSKDFSSGFFGSVPKQLEPIFAKAKEGEPMGS